MTDKQQSSPKSSRRRGRGRRGGKQHKKPPSTESKDDFESWLEAALASLGPLPKSDVWRQADDNDATFQALTCWLEDRYIREWSLDRRRALREDFWSSIEDYLTDLDCPYSAWREDLALRRRVIYWLVVCATTEVYGDEVGEEQPQDLDLSTATDADAADLALGFTTGDNVVDGILKLARMHLLLDLEQEQDEINQSIAELQRLSVTESKPLKQYRQHKGKR